MYRKAVNVLLPLLALIVSFGPGDALADSTTDNSISSGHCPTVAPGPVTIYDLDNILPSVTSQDVVAVDAIRNTLAQYPFAIDGRNYDRLDRVFTQSAVVNYSAPVGVLSGLPAIKTIGTSLAMFNRTQHAYSTQYIKICSPASAIAITYYSAAHFFTPELAPTFAPDTQVLYAYGQYQDTLAKQSDGTWKITYRNLVYQVSSLPFLKTFPLINWIGSSHHQRGLLTFLLLYIIRRSLYMRSTSAFQFCCLVKWILLIELIRKPPFFLRFESVRVHLSSSRGCRGR